MVFFLKYFFYLQFYVLDAETQLLGLWCMFVGTCYHNFSDPIAKYFDDIADGILEDRNKEEDAVIEQMLVLKQHHVNMTTIYKDFEAVHAENCRVMSAHANATQRQIKHNLRDMNVTQLNAQITKEQAEYDINQATIIAGGIEEVQKTLGSEQARSQALENAFAAIADPNSPVKGVDPVAVGFSDFFKTTAKKQQDLMTENALMSEELKKKYLDSFRESCVAQGQLHKLPGMTMKSFEGVRYNDLQPGGSGIPQSEYLKDMRSIVEDIAPVGNKGGEYEGDVLWGETASGNYMTGGKWDSEKIQAGISKIMAEKGYDLKTGEKR